MKKKIYPVQFGEVFVIPRFFNTLNIYMSKFTDEEFEKRLKEAKTEWLKYDIHEWFFTLEQASRVIFRLYKSLYEMNKEILYYKELIKEIQTELEKLKDLHPELLNLYQFLLENKNFKEV